MVPLIDWVMPWHTLLRSSDVYPSTRGGILSEMAGDTAHLADTACIQARRGCKLVCSDFLALLISRFVYWKKQFPQEVQDMKGVSHGFNRGLDLMNEAIKLGSLAPQRLKKPVYTPLAQSSKPVQPKPKIIKPVIETDITFRQVAEDFVGGYDLVFLPLGRSHESGRPLFKLSRGVDGKGLTCYFGDDAVFALGDEGYRAVSLEDLVKRATA